MGNIYKEHIKTEAFNLFFQFYRDIISDEEKAKECALISLKFFKKSDYRFKPMHGGWICGISYFEDIEEAIKNINYEK